VKLLPGIRHVKEMHGNGGTLRDVIPPVLPRPYVHPPIDLAGIRGDDLTAPFPGQTRRKPGFPRRRRSQKDDQIRLFTHIPISRDLRKLLPICTLLP